MAKKQPLSNILTWYTAEESASYAGLTTDMVNYLCRFGIVKPTGSTKRGRGCVRKYTFSDILLLRVVAKLLANGISILKLKKSLGALQKRGGSPQEVISKKYLATDGKNIYLRDNGVLELLASGQLAFAFVLELETVRSELSEIIGRRKTRVS